jgi:hypothetical protein
MRSAPSALRPAQYENICLFLSSVSTVSSVLAYKETMPAWNSLPGKIGKTLKNPGKNSKINEKNNCKNWHCFPAFVRNTGWM